MSFIRASKGSFKKIIRVMKLKYCKREKLVQFATLKRSGKLGELDFSKTSGIVTEDAPFSYWPIALPCPQVFAKVNSAQFPRLVFLKWREVVLRDLSHSVLHGKSG